MKSSKIAARLLSVVLAVMMLFSLVTVGFTASAAEVETAETGATIPAGSYLYLKPNSNWTQSSAWFAMYIWGTDAATWVKMEKVADASATVYRAQVPAGTRDKVIFCRMNPSATALDWASKWDQSVDLTYTSGKNCWAPAAGQWNNATGTWSTYADATLVTAPATPAAATVTFNNTFGGTGTEADPYLVAPAAKTSMIVTGTLGSANGLAYNVNYTATKVDWTVGSTSVLYEDLTAPALDETAAVNVYLWAYNKAGTTVKYSAEYATTTVYIKGYEAADTPDVPVVDNSFELGYEKADGLYAYAKTLAEGETLGANAWQRWHENSDGRNFYLPGSASDTEVIILNTYSATVLINGVMIPAGEYAVVPYTAGVKYACSGATTQSVTIYKTDAEGTIFMNAQADTTYKNDKGEKGNLSDLNTDLYAFMTSGSKNQETGKVAGAVASEADGVQEDTTVKKLKGRGNSTWNLAKKPFNITYNDNIQIDGMKGKKWSLLANAQDASLLRNRLVYDLANEVNMKYACDSRFVDMFVDGYYKGSYQLTQKIEMGKNTVMPDLEEPLVEVEEEGDVVPTENFDFILELDTAINAANAGDQTFTTDRGQTMTHKTPDEPTAEQVAFMDKKYQALEDALYGDDLATLATLVDINDFARAYLVNEVAKNLDSGVTSCYFVYDSDAGIFYMSPVWDYDNALGNSVSIQDRHDASGKMLDLTKPSGWYAKELMHYDTNFKGGRSVFSQACYMTSKTADGKSFMDIVKDVWAADFADTAAIIAGKADSANGRLESAEDYISTLAMSGNWNYASGWAFSSNNGWISDHSSLTMYNFDAETAKLTSSIKKYDQSKFEDQANYAADWMISRINWISAQFAEVEETAPEGFVTIYFQNNWKWSNPTVYFWNSKTAATPAWPGNALTNVVETTKEGYDIFEVYVPADAEGFLFAGTGEYGAEQCEDIKGTTEGLCYYMTYVEATGKKIAESYEYKVPAEPETTAPEVTEPVVTDPVVTEPVVTEPVAEEYITIYFSNAWMWKDVRVHTFGSKFAADTEWPGAAMTFVEKNEWGQEIYKAVVAADVKGIVFTGMDGETLKQSADIVPEDGYGYYMDWSEEDGEHTDKYVYAPYVPSTPDETEPVVTEPVVTEPEATEPEATEATKDEAETITVYFSNAWMWTDITAYYWNADGDDNTWPGTPMTFVEKNDLGQDIYKAEIAADAVGLIFAGKDNGNDTQSPNITDIKAGYGYYMDWSEDKGTFVGSYEYAPVVPEETTVPTEPEATEPEATEPEATEPEATEPEMPTVVTVYAINSAKWAEVCAYCWDAAGVAGASWPGVAMEKTDETVNGFDVYAISFSSDYANIIFNNNDKGSQTDNLTVKDGQYYDIKAKTWYASLDDVPAADPLSTNNFLVGSFNGWSTTANEFKFKAEGEKVGYVELELAAGDYEFKIVRNDQWTAPKTATTITKSVAGITFSSSGEANVKMTVAEAGTYVFAFGSDNSQLAVTYPGQEPATPDEPVVDTTVKIAGSFTDWNKTEMTADETGKIFTITDIRLEAGKYEFKIVEFGTWMGNAGTIENTADGWTFKAKDAEGNDVGNCTLNTKGGVYTFVFDTETDKLTVTAVLDKYTYDVTWNEGNFTVNAPASIDEATDLTFTVDAAEGYKVSAVIVDMQVLTAVDGVYTIANVQGDIEILVIVAEDVVVPEVMTFTVTFVDKDGNTLATETVEYGAAATAPAAPAVEGYNFTGWDTDFDFVTKDITVKATYKKISAPIVPATTGKLRIELAGGTSFTIAVNDGAARPQGASYTNTKMTIGATVTLVANTTGEAAFLGWMDETGAIRSTTDTLTFVTTGNDYYKAVYQTVVEGVNVVTFKNSKAAGGNGQILDMQYYAAGDEITFPAAPTQAGYDFTGWSMTADQIQAALAAGQDVTVEATWELAKVYVNITVNGGKITVGNITNGQGLAYNAYTVTADAAPAGQKFAYWVDANGKVMSYLETYKFYPAADIELTAVYVAEDETVVKKELVQISGDPTTAGTKIAYMVSWEIDESFGTVTNYGVVFVNEKDYNEDTFYHGSGDSKMFDRALAASGAVVTKQLTLSQNQGVAYDNTYLIKGFVIYTNAAGESVTVYSDILATYKPAP